MDERSNTGEDISTLHKNLSSLGMDVTLVKHIPPSSAGGIDTGGIVFKTRIGATMGVDTYLVLPMQFSIYESAYHFLMGLPREELPAFLEPGMHELDGITIDPSVSQEYTHPVLAFMKEVVNKILESN